MYIAAITICIKAEPSFLCMFPQPYNMLVHAVDIYNQFVLRKGHLTFTLYN